MMAGNVLEAERNARTQRMHLAALLRLNEAKASAQELRLAQAVIDVSRDNPKRYETALVIPTVNALFQAGILYFEAPR